MKISARYEVLGLLGQGGMGVVYHVRDTTRGRENALKTLAPGRSEDIVERFLTEAQVMFRLEHANIVRVYDFGKDGETYFLTMELIRGKNLRQLLNARQNKGFPLAEVIRMGIQAADALNYAHSQKPEAVVHRDIKPVNIMIEEESGRVVVTDFGIAKLMADTGGGETQIGNAPTHTVFAGTVPYSAPEQFLAAGTGRRLDARVDIYALGIVLYEIYTGRHFFAGLSAEEVEQHHRSIETGECPVKRAHACDHKVSLPDTPEAFVRVLEKAIARDRNARYRTAAELLADLQACAAVESVQAVEAARVAAEAAGAVEAAPTEFRRGGELEQRAQAAQAEGDLGKAGALYQDALQAFGAAAAQAGERRAQRAAQQAKAAMQIVAREATERDTGALAPDAMRHAAELVAAAEASDAQGQFEQAAAQYREAEAAFRGALVAARQASARRAIEDELPALRAARERAEEVDAATLAADAFAEAVREQLRLEEALAAGELTRVRELLPKVRDGFAGAAEAAARRLAQNVEDARAAMRAVAAEATAAGAPTSAKAAFIEAETLAAAAEKLVERGQLELAAAQLGRAAEAYRAAVGAAARAGERARLAQELPAIRAARAEAERADAPALAADAFDVAAARHAELEAALDAGELTRVRALLSEVGAGFAAAAAAAAAAKKSRAAAVARDAMAAARDAACAAGAERHTPDALAKARAREKEAADAERREDWARAETLYVGAAEAYEEVRAAAARRAEEERLAGALAEARSAAETARARAKEADAPTHATARWEEAVALAKKAAGAANDATGMAAATADYVRAAEGFDTATAEAERALRREDVQAQLAAVAEARAEAVAAGAERRPEFRAAADELAAAERALAVDELSLVVSSAAAARDRFAAAKSAAERAQAEAAADATLAEVAARAAEASEAGAESLAAATWTRAVARQKDALARRHDGDPDRVLPLAAEALAGFTAALEEAVEGAERAAVAARESAETAGAEEREAASAAKTFAGAEQRRADGQLVAAAVAFRKATSAYEGLITSRAESARSAESAAAKAQRDADAAEASRFAGEAHARAVSGRKKGTDALAAGAYRDAEREFTAAADAFRAATEAAARERRKASAAAARSAADAAREQAAAAKAGDLAAAELKAATDAYAAATRAFEAEQLDAAERDFAKARDLFGRAHERADAVAREREAAGARARVDALRGSRAAAATGFFARRKLAKADAVVARATAAAASGDFAAALAAFDEAAALFEAMPAAPAAEPPPAAAPKPKAKGKGSGPAAKPKDKAKDAAPQRKPAPAPSATPRETTQLGDDATFVTPPPGDLTVVDRAPADDATVVAAAPAMQDATFVASAAGDATVVASGAHVAAADATRVDRAVPAAAPARGLPVGWIGAAAAGVLLLGGTWMARDLLSGRSTAEPPVPRIAEPAKKLDPPPPVRKVDVAPPVENPVVPPPPAATAEPPTQLAKVEEPPPPAPPKAPAIASFAPTDPTVEAADGAQEFRIALADPTDATYAWSVDGKTVRDATEPSLRIEPGAEPKRITVVASTAGGTARQEWQLAALARPTPAPPPAAPVISGFEPNDATIELPLGRSQRFTLRAKAADGSPLRYAWSVDGKAAGTGATFSFKADDGDEGATRRIRAEVSAGGPTAEREWTVSIPFGPVTIASLSPRASSIQTNLGEATDFSVDARAGRDRGDALAYRWTVDRRPADADGARFTYRPDRPGTADVEVRVEAPGRQPATRRWTVRAREPEVQPTELPRVAVAPRATPAPPPARAGNARAELESWIDAYRAAYEQKNVDKLVSLGVISSDKRSALKSALDDLDELSVRIASKSIEVQGPDSAVVTLTREDSYNARGARRSQSINIKKTLRKVNGAWVAQ